MSLNATNLYIQASPLPATFQGTPNDFFAEMIRRMRILSPSGTNFIFIGDTEPTSNVGPWLKNGTQWYVWDASVKKYRPQDITASFTPAFSIGHSTPSVTNPPVWLQTTKDATTASPLDYGDMIRWFVWNGTMWLSPHPINPSSSERRIWVGTEAEIWSHDGGDGSDPAANPPSDTTGAMWVRDTNFNFRFPVGVGTNPTAYGADPNTSVAVGDTGGEEKHVLTVAELAAHTHASPSALFGIVDGITQADSGSAGLAVGGSAAATASTGSGTAHNTMPPFIGVFFIKRSARKFYTP